MSDRFNPAMSVLATGANITTGVASASSAIPVNSAGEIPRYIRVAVTAAAHVRIRATSATAVTTDMLVMPGDAVTLHVPNGVTHIAAIQNAAAGSVNVTPLENS